jgi:hypothetical protein
MANKELQKIREYNTQFGFTQEQLREMVESGRGLEFIVGNTSNLRDNSFITYLNSSTFAMYGLKFEDLEAIAVNGLEVKKKKIKNKSYGQNNVDIYLFDLYKNHNGGTVYSGSFIIRHGHDNGSENGAYVALKRQEAMHNLKSAANYR